MTDPMAIKIKAAENIMFAVNDLNDTEKDAISYTKHEFITKCSFNGRPCSIDELDFNSKSFLLLLPLGKLDRYSPVRRTPPTIG